MKIKNPVDLIILNNKNQILLAKRSEKEDWYAVMRSIPWWTSDFWESIEETLQREIKEELWCKIKWMNYFKSYFSQISNELACRTFYFYWEIEWEIKLNSELLEYKWFDIEEIDFNMAYNQQIVISDFAHILNSNL